MALLGAGGMVGLAAHSRWGEPYWVEFHDVPMPIAGLPPAFVGMRVAHLTDLHVGDAVPMAYLRGVIDRVNADKPDVVVITGDLITEAARKWIDPAVDLLSGLTAPTFVTFGNHDCGVYGRLPRGRGNLWTADVIEQKLAARGIVTLRNASHALVRGGTRLWLVGMEDLWGGYFLPEVAFDGVPRDEPAIALSHNPDTAADVAHYGPRWVLSGHTHGGQVRLPLLGALLLPVRDKRLDQGMFEVGGSRLYVSRGVGHLLPVRVLCRPEVATFVLRRG